jgi:hypothetical protein
MANANPGTTPVATDETTPVEVEFSEGPATAELTLVKPRGMDDADKATANKMLSIITAKGYHADGKNAGVSIATVATNGFYPDEAAANEAAKPLASLLRRVAPDDKNVGVAVAAKSQGDIEGFGFSLFLKPKGAPRAPRTDEQKAAAKAKREAAKAANPA